MLKFAQFGAGRIGTIHATNLAAMPNARLVAIVDVNLPAEVIAARVQGRPTPPPRSPIIIWASSPPSAASRRW